MERNIGAGVNQATSYTIPNAPTTLGNPLVFAQINVATANLYIVMVTPTGPTTFTYYKRFWNGSSTLDASGETFNYIALWL